MTWLTRHALAMDAAVPHSRRATAPGAAPASVTNIAQSAMTSAAAMVPAEKMPILMSQGVWGDPAGSLEPIKNILKSDLENNGSIVPSNN